jgi:UDP-N-acetylmuramoyl-tripeptide--D-alanyl-D-alanine ligase
VRFTLAEAARWTGGTLHGASVPCDGAAVDSRAARPGQLFVALRGQRTDGHAFVPQALAAAAAALVERPVEGAGGPCLVVPDALRAFQALGRRLRDRSDAVVVAVTGSVGKTSVKELLHRALAALGPGAAASEGNLNSRVGVPLSVCNLPEGTATAVLEMGINQPGEMAELGSVAPPDVALFTGVHPVHTEFFGTLAVIAREKAALAAFVRPGGALVYPAMDRHLAPLLSALPMRKVTFGPGGDMELKIGQDRGFAGMSGTLVGPRSLPFTLDNPSLHPGTVLAAAAALLALGLPPEAALEAARDYRPAGNRLRLRRSRSGVTFVDDCYNASPHAVEALLERFRRTPAEGRKAFVLGDMLELGPFEGPAHRQAGEDALGRVDLLVAFGPRAALAARAFAEASGTAIECGSVEAVAEALRSWLRPGDWVAVKGSRGMRLERLFPLMEVDDAV